MDAHYAVEIPNVFVAGDTELKKMADLLSERIGPLRIRADCADGVSRTFKNVKELGAFENTRDKEIRRLHLSARSDDLQKKATIDLAGSQWRGISLDFQARDDVVSRLKAEVLEIIGGMRPRYAVFQRVNFVFIPFVALLLLWFISLVAVAFKWIPDADSKESSPSSSAFATLVLIGGVVILFMIGVVLNRFRDSVFPYAVFLIGQGKARFRHLERIHWGIIIAFGVSFCAGVITLVLQAILA